MTHPSAVTSCSVAAVDAGQSARRRLERMRWIDHWLGLPLCFLCGLGAVAARKLFGERSRVISGQGAIAILKFFGLGSILETTPLLRAIRRRYPGARLVFVTFDSCRPLVERIGLCHEVRVIRTHSIPAFVRDVFGALVWLRRRRVEAVIDLEFFSKFSTLFSFATRARIRVGFFLVDFWRRSLLTHPVYFNYFRHIADVYAHAGRRLDAPVVDATLSRLEAPPAAAEGVRRFLHSHGWTERHRLVGVNVNAGELSWERRWTAEKWIALIQMLLDRHSDCYVVLTGSPSEQPHVEAVAAGLPAPLRPRVLVAAGQWSFDEFVAVLPLLNVFVTGDSGPLHLAAAQGAPVVALWGPTRPDFYSPRVPTVRNIYQDYPCSPCVCMFTTFAGMWCRHEAWCMEAIAPARVLETVEAMLAEHRPAGGNRT